MEFCLFVLEDILAHYYGLSIVYFIKFNNLLFFFVILEGVSVLRIFDFLYVSLLLVDKVVKLITIKFPVILDTEPVFIWTKMVFVITFKILCFPIKELLLKSIGHVITIEIMKPARNIIHSTQHSKNVLILQFKRCLLLWFLVIDNDMLLIDPLIMTQLCLINLNILLWITILHTGLKSDPINKEA